MAAYKAVRVELDDSMMKKLKDGKYDLCFAKRVDGLEYNTVWQRYPPNDYLSNNTFSWQPSYKMVAINDYPEESRRTKSASNICDIAPGQICVLDRYGALQPAVSGGREGALSLRNDYGDIRVGIYQSCTDIRGGSEFSSIFVTPSFIIRGTASFHPIDKLLIWFEQNAYSGDRFQNMRGDAYEIDLTANSECVLFYNRDGNWEHRGYKL